MDKITSFFDSEEEQMLEETERFKKILMHLRFEGKPTQGKNIKESRKRMESFLSAFRRHRDVQEKLLFPFLVTHIPKHELAIRFLQKDHDEMRKSQRKISVMLREFQKNRRHPDKAVSLHKAGRLLVQLVKHHVELEKRSIHRTWDHQLKQHERTELERKIKKWQAAHEKFPV